MRPWSGIGLLSYIVVYLQETPDREYVNTFYVPVSLNPMQLRWPTSDRGVRLSRRQVTATFTWA